MNALGIEVGFGYVFLEFTDKFNISLLCQIFIQSCNFPSYRVRICFLHFYFMTFCEVEEILDIRGNSLNVALKHVPSSSGEFFIVFSHT